MSDYAYDDDVLEEVARRLYAALPAMYRVADEPHGDPYEAVPGRPPPEPGDLRAFLEVLAAPLGVLRQSIQELHADLFIDTADDRIVPYLAEMVGTTLVFPDAASNRRDVRGTVGWRRRKGTPAALEEMGAELTTQPVVLQEGWKRIQMAQDLNLLRPERVSVDVRPAVVAEQATGPLDTLFHTADMRPISASTGRRHPLHVAHWVHPTVTFPLEDATAVDRTLADSDVRYALDPLGVRRPLRARRMPGDRGPFADRIQELHFATAPEHTFAQPGGFTVRVCGLSAGIAPKPAAERVPSVRVADRGIARGTLRMSALSLPSRGWRGTVRVELGLVTTPAGSGAGSWRPNPASFDLRAGIDLGAAGVLDSTSETTPLPGGTRVPVLRISTPGAAGRLLPGATLELAGDAPGSTAASGDTDLAREGFLAGVLHAAIPPLEIRGTRFLHLAADGSVYDAGTSDDLLDMPRGDDGLQLEPAALLRPGPGPAWPPLPAEAEPTMLTRVPAAPGRGSAVMHGALPLQRTAGGIEGLQAGSACALSFAVQVEGPSARFRPFQRLTWTGSDPRQGTWIALNQAGRAIAADAAARRYAQIADLRETDADRIALAVRFECSQTGATLCAGEIAWSSDDGSTVLIYLPQLDAEPAAGRGWPTEPPFEHVSDPVRVAEDGSTWASDSTANRRVSLGAVAPIAEAAGLRRRRVRWRRLCAWDREDWSASPPETLAPTRPGRLDVDVEHGLFAFAAEEPPQAWPAGPTGERPPSVSTDYEEGATMHIGARPAAREPVLDERLPTPTRLVSRSGRLHRDAPAEWHGIPLYDSLQEALAAVSARWAALPPGQARRGADEVVQFEDSATYPNEAPVWPTAPTGTAARVSLTIQAAERERPVVLVDPEQDWDTPAGARYAALTLRGFALGGEGWSGMTLPTADRVTLELCSVLHAENTLEFGDVPAGADVSVRLCETAGLVLAGPGNLVVADSIVDASFGVALRAAEGEVSLDRVSVGGDVGVRVLEASEVIFDGRVTVEDRFRGCVRYSRVTGDSTLPRAYRVVFDTPVGVVSRNRRDPAWWRLREDCAPAIGRGAENGSELGAFSLTQLAERMAGFQRRLAEFTPVGLVTGIIRID
jgi:hypothetical protein